LIAALGAVPTYAADLPITPIVVPPPAFRLPAVSRINGKVDFAIGAVTSLQTFGPGYVPSFRAQAALSIPVGDKFGIQIDGVVSTTQGTLFTHAAGHFFWRNPETGLAGAYAAISQWSGVTRIRLGAEGEYYWNNISVEALVGAEIIGIPVGMFAIVDLAFYTASENLRFSVGARHNFAGNSLALGAEYQVHSGQNVGWAIFADAELSQTYQAIFGGLRLYFGDDKTLMRRHREDDPRIHADERSLIDCFGAYAADGLIALDGAYNACYPVD
jgi:hypothetical protein